jgi:hypothetical protein
MSNTTKSSPMEDTSWIAGESARRGFRIYARMGGRWSGREIGRWRDQDDLIDISMRNLSLKLLER